MEKKNRTKNKCLSIFESLITDEFSKNFNLQPHEYVNICWGKLNDLYPQISTRERNEVFRLIIISLLIRENVVPFHINAKISGAPYTIFDVILFTSQYFPITLTIKTDFRKNINSINLECISLRYNQRRSQSYLLTLEPEACSYYNNQISQGNYLGLDRVILCSCSHLDKFITELKNYSYLYDTKFDFITNSMKIG